MNRGDNDILDECALGGLGQSFFDKYYIYCPHVSIFLALTALNRSFFVSTDSSCTNRSDG
jgi:hypothetical protein